MIMPLIFKLKRECCVGTCTLIMLLILKLEWDCCVRMYMYTHNAVDLKLEWDCCVCICYQFTDGSVCSVVCPCCHPHRDQTQSEVYC